MSAKILVWILAGGLTLGAIGFAWRAHRRADVALTAIAKMREKQPAWGAAVQTRLAEIAEHEKQRVEVQAAMAKLKTAKTTVPAGAPPQRKMNLAVNPMEAIA